MLKIVICILILIYAYIYYYFLFESRYFFSRIRYVIKPVTFIFIVFKVIIKVIFFFP